MSPPSLQLQFAARLKQLREGKGWTQDQLAAYAGLHRTHISLIERGKRIVRLETVEKLAAALRVRAAELFVPPDGPAHAARPSLEDDLAEARSLYPAVERFQALASRHGIDDIFQDNGGKLLQVLLVLGLKKLPKREGNDAIDADGNELELKSLNHRLTTSFSTHHHLNPAILAKYRAVHAWYFAVFEHIVLRRIYRLTPDQLEEGYFKPWGERWAETRRDINNPKIPLKFVAERGELVYELPTSS